MAITPTYELDVYQEDDSTLLFDVSTDPAHARPYLMVPDSFPEQEVSFGKGAASIGQLTLRVVDVRTVSTDQDTGYLTGQLPDATTRYSQLIGHRAVLLEDPGSGPITILDGVIHSVRLLDNWAGYEIGLRDIRERERQTKAFQNTTTPTILPPGVLDGYGPTVNGVKTPLPAITEQPLKSVFILENSSEGVFTFDAQEGLPDIRNNQRLWDALHSVSRLAGNPEVVVHDRWQILWRDTALGGAYSTISNVALQHPSKASDRDTISKNFAGDDDVARNAPERTGLWGLIANNFVDAQSLPAADQAVDVIVQYVGPVTEEWPYHLEGLTVGELIRNLYRGDYSNEDPRMRYDETALLALKTSVRAIIKEPVEDLRAWVEKHAWPIANAAPTLDAQGRVAPIEYALPDSGTTLVVIDDSNAAPAGGGWSQGSQDAINIVRVEYFRDYRDREGNVQEIEVTEEHRVQASIDLLGERPLEIKSGLLRAIGTDRGRPLTGDVQDETGSQVASRLTRVATDRFALGGQYFSLRGDRGDADIEGLKVGTWVDIQVSWMPDYDTGTRGLSRLAQVVGRKNQDAAWCLLTLIDAGPAASPLDPPTLGTLSVTAAGVVTVPVATLGTGSPDCRIDYAVNATEPAADSELWTYLVRTASTGDQKTPELPAGGTCWVRARSEDVGRRPSGWTTAASIAIPQTARVFRVAVSLDDDGVPTLTWEPNAYALGLTLDYEVHLLDADPTFPNTVDVDATLGTHEFSSLTVYNDQVLSVRVTPFDGWTGSAVSGTAGVITRAESGLGVIRPLQVIPSFLQWKTKLVEQPPAPTSFTATEATTQNNVDLTWIDQATDETLYEIQRAPDDGSGSGAPGAPTTYVIIESSLPADTEDYTDTDSATLSTGDYWWYRVRCRNRYGWSDFVEDSVDLTAA